MPTLATTTDEPARLGRRARLAAHGFVLLFLAGWAAYSATVESYVLPGPWLVGERLWLMLGDVHEVVHLLWTVFHIVTAVVIAFFLGSGLALLAHHIGVTRLVIHGRIAPFLNAFSGIGWTFLAIIWFGISDQTVIFVISMVLIPFALINMKEGLEALDWERLEMARSFTRAPFRRFFLVTLPSLYPFIFATIRISFGVAWKVALTAELFGGDKGMGYLLNLARQDFDMPLVLAVILVIIAFVYLTERLIFQPLQARASRRHDLG